jgi:hypothetical protein
MECVLRYGNAIKNFFVFAMVVSALLIAGCSQEDGLTGNAVLEDSGQDNSLDAPAEPESGLIEELASTDAPQIVSDSNQDAPSEKESSSKIIVTDSTRSQIIVHRTEEEPKEAPRRSGGGSSRDRSPPGVSSMLPASGAVQVAFDTSIEAIFTEAMDPGTITTSTFILLDASSAPVSGSVSYADGRAVFVPDANLSVNTTYTAIITSDARDLKGNPLANHTWIFTTKKDTCTGNIAPTLVGTTPEDQSLEVGLDEVVLASLTPAVLDVCSVSTVQLFPVTCNGGTITTDTLSNSCRRLVCSNEAGDNMEISACDRHGGPASFEVYKQGQTGSSITQMCVGQTCISDNGFASSTIISVSSPDGASVFGALGYNGQTVSFDAMDSFMPNTSYTAEIAIEGLDRLGNPQREVRAWVFTTGSN